MIEEVELPDGTDAFVLPLQRTDRATLAAEFETLSPESRRSRFLGTALHLNDVMLETLVDDVDGIDHIALVLCAETRPDVYDPVGLARIVRYADVPDAADLAVTVKDEWHGRGVATALLGVLMRMRPLGVERIVTDVFSDNRASMKMLHRLGRTTVTDLGSGVSEVIVELEPLESVAPTPPLRTGPDAHHDTTVRNLSSTGVVAGQRPLLRDPTHRHVLRTRDQVCPWFA